MQKEKIWQAALKKLEIRPLSCGELKTKLFKDFPNEEALIDEVIEEMRRVELLNDARLLEQWIRHLSQKPIGRLKVMVEVKKRQLDINEIDRHLLNLNWSERESAQKALEGKRIVEQDPRKRKQKLVYFLRSRGFTDRVIFSVVSKFFE